MKQKAQQSPLHVKVISPSQVFYEGPAASVTAENKVGAFDVLPNHANFFSLLTKGDIVIDTQVTKLRFPIQNGIIKVTNNKITLFIYLPGN